MQVYRNLRRSGVWYSVRDKTTRKVTDRAQWILLKDCKFVVGAKGRSRVLRERQKNVHAYIEGSIVITEHSLAVDMSEPTMMQKISYNPYENDKFLVNGFKEISGTGNTVLFTPFGVFLLY